MVTQDASHSSQDECEALPGVAYPGVRDNCSTLNTKTGYDDDDEIRVTHTNQTNRFLTET